MADAVALERTRAHFARWTRLLDAATPPFDERQERAMEITVELLQSCGLDPFGPDFDRGEMDDLRSTIQALVDLLEHVPAGERVVRRDVGVLVGGVVEGPFREQPGDMASPEGHAEIRARVLRGQVVRRQVITVTTPWEQESLTPLARRHAAERADLERRHAAELAALEQTCPGGC